MPNRTNTSSAGPDLQGRSGISAALVATGLARTGELDGQRRYFLPR